MAKKYFVLRGEKRDGPFGAGELRHFIKAGILKPDDLCARDGDPEWRPVKTVLPPVRRTPGLQVAGVILCAVAGLTLFYFLFLFDVSVYTNAGRVVNLDLLNQRQNGVILSAAAALAGVGCLIANAVRKQ